MKAALDAAQKKKEIEQGKQLPRDLDDFPLRKWTVAEARKYAAVEDDKGSGKLSKTEEIQKQMLVGYETKITEQHKVLNGILMKVFKIREDYLALNEVLVRSINVIGN